MKHADYNPEPQIYRATRAALCVPLRDHEGGCAWVSGGGSEALVYSTAP